MIQVNRQGGDYFPQANRRLDENPRDDLRGPWA